MCLQELGTNRDIPHQVIQSHTVAGSLSAIIIHPRRVPQLRSWQAAEGTHPTAVFTEGDVVFSITSIYLPHAGREKKHWDTAIESLKKSVALPKNMMPMLLGDFNTHKFVDELPLQNAGKWKGKQDQLLHDRVVQLQDIMVKGALSRIPTPNAEETYKTMIPGCEDRVLPTRFCHMVKDSYHNENTHLSSDHTRLELVMDMGTSTTQRRRRRCRHPGTSRNWNEQAPGQLSSLVGPKKWHSVEALERHC